jgi:diguanylate cyclase (GGDEF)-like protein
LNARGRSPSPSSADLNGLKTANDELGHAVGDALLHRAGEVFGSLVDKPASFARIGGDEFAVLLPATDIAGGEAVLATLAGLIETNNQYYPDFELSISTGIATSRPGDRLEQVVKRADMKMLHAKRLYYLQANRDRRGTGAA